MSQSGSFNNLANVTQFVPIVIRGPEVDFVTPGVTSLYTFTEDFVVTGFILNCTAITGAASSGTAAYNLGWTAAAYTNIVGGASTYSTALTNESGFYLPATMNDFPRIPAGQTLRLNLTSGDATAVVLTERVDIVGYYFVGSTAVPSSSSLTLTGDTGGPLGPIAGNWNILGGTGIDVAGSGNTLTINSTVSSISWTDVIGTSQAIAANSGYTANNGSLVTLTLPNTCSYGSLVRIVGKGAGGWKIAQNAGQLIHFGASTSTTGVAGSIASTQQFDTVELLCTVADTTFTVLSAIGNLTVV